MVPTDDASARKNTPTPAEEIFPPNPSALAAHEQAPAETQDDVRTSRMPSVEPPPPRVPSVQPPPFRPFSPQQIDASLHVAHAAPLPPPSPPPAQTRVRSWAPRPGTWWPKLTQMVQRKGRTVEWTQQRVGITAALTGATIVLVALVGVYVDLGFASGRSGREALAITTVVARVIIALALAAFGWGLVRLGERLAARASLE